MNTMRATNYSPEIEVQARKEFPDAFLRFDECVNRQRELGESEKSARDVAYFHFGGLCEAACRNLKDQPQ